MKIACLLHSLLKAIHEWIAVIGPLPTYLSLLSTSGVRVRFFGRPYSESIWWPNEAASSMSGRSGRAYRWCNFACSVAAAIY
jgi:hypothetical protein